MNSHHTKTPLAPGAFVNLFFSSFRCITPFLFFSSLIVQLQRDIPCPSRCGGEVGGGVYSRTSTEVRRKTTTEDNVRSLEKEGEINPAKTKPLVSKNHFQNAMRDQTAHM